MPKILRAAVGILLSPVRSDEGLFLHIVLFFILWGMLLTTLGSPVDTSERCKQIDCRPWIVLHRYCPDSDYSVHRVLCSTWYRLSDRLPSIIATELNPFAIDFQLGMEGTTPFTMLWALVARLIVVAFNLVLGRSLFILWGMLVVLSTVWDGVYITGLIAASVISRAVHNSTLLVWLNANFSTFYRVRFLGLLILAPIEYFCQCVWSTSLLTIIFRQLRWAVAAAASALRRYCNRRFPHQSQSSVLLVVWWRAASRDPPADGADLCIAQQVDPTPSPSATREPCCICLDTAVNCTLGKHGC